MEFKMSLLKKLAFGILSVSCYLTSLLFIAMSFGDISNDWNSTKAKEDMALVAALFCSFSVIFAIFSWVLALFGRFMFLKTIEAKVFYLSVVIICLLRIIDVIPYLNG